MNIKYHKYLDIEVTNSYFLNGLCQVFNIIPLGDTVKSLKNYDILIQKRNNIFSFYAGITEEESFDLATKFEGLHDMYFQLILEDPLFSNFTNLPSFDAQQILYFSNSSTATTFQKSQFVSEEDILSIRQQSFLLTLSEDSSNVEIKDKTGAVVDHYEFLDLKKGPISLDNLNTGVYEIWMNGKKIEVFFYSKMVLPINCMAILKLDIDELIQQNSSGAGLTLDFEAREVYWQYQVIVPDSRKIEVSSMGIIGIQEEVYNGPVEQTIVGGQIANVFTSSIPLKLRRELLKNPVLKLNFSNRTNDMDLKLPNPSAENLRAYNNQQNEISFCATTIVYV